MKISLKPNEKQLWQFGLFGGLIGFPVIAFVAARFWSAPSYVWIGILVLAGICLLGALTKMFAVVRPVYVAMAAVGAVIGMIVAPILFALIYFLLITPVALWFKLRGRDSMARALDPDASTYWTTVEGAKAPGSYLKLY